MVYRCVEKCFSLMMASKIRTVFSWADYDSRVVHFLVFFALTLLRLGGGCFPSTPVDKIIRDRGGMNLPSPILDKNSPAGIGLTHFCTHTLSLPEIGMFFFISFVNRL